MIDILALLQCLTPEMNATLKGQMERIVVAMLAMSGRVTMLGLSRWAGEGGSYRTIQRFYNTTVDWGQIHWLLIKTHLLQCEANYILAGDEVAVSYTHLDVYKRQPLHRAHERQRRLCS